MRLVLEQGGRRCEVWGACSRLIDLGPGYFVDTQEALAFKTEGDVPTDVTLYTFKMIRRDLAVPVDTPCPYYPVNPGGGP
jgi:hypothetical protein